MINLGSDESDVQPYDGLPMSVVLAVGSVVGRFRIEEQVGKGSAGTVYRAIDTHNDRLVALKHVVDPALRQRFEREAAALARLDHPAIVKYVGHGETESESARAGGADGPGDGMYLAMEWLEGEDLKQRIDRGALGFAAARVLGLRLASALAHAHALGCIHRDVSPPNVFLPHKRVEEAKLLDFGLVRLSLPGEEITRTQAVLGTPYYMSPEHVRDPASVDFRSDLFALGVLLYEVTAGVRPFDSVQLFTLWDQIANLPPPDLRKTAPEPPPEWFVTLIESMLAKDPLDRPASAGEVHRRLTMGDGSDLPDPSAPSATMSAASAVHPSAPVPLPPRAIVSSFPPPPLPLPEIASLKLHYPAVYDPGGAVGRLERVVAAVAGAVTLALIALVTVLLFQGGGSTSAAPDAQFGSLPVATTPGAAATATSR